MRSPTRLIMMTTVSLALAACGSGEDETNMPMAGANGQMATSQGTVTAVDDEVGTITIDHEAIPEANWPAMTMGFKADEAARAKVESGDEVEFDLRLDGNSGEITRIERQ